MGWLIRVLLSAAVAILTIACGSYPPSQGRATVFEYKGVKYCAFISETTKLEFCELSGVSTERWVTPPGNTVFKGGANPSKDELALAAIMNAWSVQWRTPHADDKARMSVWQELNPDFGKVYAAWQASASPPPSAHTP